MNAAAFPARVLGAGGRVDGEVVAGPAPARVKVVSHEGAPSSSLVKLRRGLVEARAQAFPKYT
eukprot:9159581-Pyramimonas_sp.AAC.1